MANQSSARARFVAVTVALLICAIAEGCGGGGDNALGAPATIGEASDARIAPRTRVFGEADLGRPSAGGNVFSSLQPSVSAPEFSSNQRDGLQQFRAGFYIYSGLLKQSASTLGLSNTSARRALVSTLTRAGFDLFYIAVGDGDDLAEWHQLFGEYPGVQLIIQLDPAYLATPSAAEVGRKSRKAIDAIRSIGTSTSIVGYSVREEPTIAHMPFVEMYFETLHEALPGVSLFLLHNDRRTMAYPLKPQPNIVGTDRYAFWGWDPSDGGYTAKPHSALHWFDSELKHFSRIALERDTLFFSVFTDLVALASTTKKNVRDGLHGDPKRISDYARDNVSGWREGRSERLMYTKYYQPPVSANRAMLWLSVLNGAKGVLNWYADLAPTVEVVREGDDQFFTYRPSIFSGEELRSGIQEYAEAVCEIRGYGEIVPNLKLSDRPSPLINDAANLVMQTHEYSGVDGAIVVVVNSQIGDVLERATPVRINDQGALLDFTSDDVERRIEIPLARPGIIYDLKSGTRMGGDGHVTLWLQPGAGRLLYAGSEEGYQKLMAAKANRAMDFRAGACQEQ